MADPEWVAYTALGLSVVSTLRPELTTLYNRLFRPPNFIIEENSLIELGFNPMGCVLSTAGVIIVQNRSIVVRHMRGTVERASDKKRIELAPKGYKDTHGDPSSPSVQINLPTAFAVGDDEPVPYWVMFAFRDRDQPVARSLTALFDAWNAYLRSSQPVTGFSGQFSSPIGMPNIGAAQWWESFKATPAFAQSTSELEAEFFWEPDDYHLTLTVEPVSGPAPSPKSWWFTITADDSQRLRENVQRLQAVACGQFPDLKIPPLNFVYVEYRSSRQKTAAKSAPPAPAA